MNSGTIALIVSYREDSPQLVESLTDDDEISLFAKAVAQDQGDPLEIVYQYRLRVEAEEEEFGDYVEELLSQPFLKAEIQEHGIQWLRSKIRIEEFKKAELEAAEVISDYAYKLFLENQDREEFFLASPKARVKVVVYKLDPSKGSFEVAA